MKKERESLLHTHSRVSIEERREGAKKVARPLFCPSELEEERRRRGGAGLPIQELIPPSTDQVGYFRLCVSIKN